MTYRAVIHDSHIGHWRAFSEPIKILQSTEVNQVQSILTQVEKAIESGQWALGFISYEASPAFESSAMVLPEANFPKVWFALFAESKISLR
jgi:para-aminobenzoate synthetase/4-amino-4-deoxychorismate lyase